MESTLRVRNCSLKPREPIQYRVLVSFCRAAELAEVEHLLNTPLQRCFCVRTILLCLQRQSKTYSDSPRAGTLADSFIHKSVSRCCQRPTDSPTCWTSSHAPRHSSLPHVSAASGARGFERRTPSTSFRTCGETVQSTVPIEALRDLQAVLSSGSAVGSTFSVWPKLRNCSLDPSLLKSFGFVGRQAALKLCCPMAKTSCTQV